MKKDYIIRLEKPEDYRRVEYITREAFWNLSNPGCDEHYIAHVIRGHEDFIPELDFVIEVNGEIAGNVMYTKAWLTDENGGEKEILTFGPVCVHPDYQRCGYGKALLEYSFERAVELGYDVIVIYGNPDNYVARGFVSCIRHKVCREWGVYPSAMLVKELREGALKGGKWLYRESPAFKMIFDSRTFEAFDSLFPPKEKKWQPSQEEFFIHSHSVMRE